MKIRLTNPTFDASAKTITHASFSDVTLAGIQLIVNVTDQIVIYNFADTAKGGALATDTLTLEYDTTSMSDTDELMVLVEDGIAYQLPTGAATEAKQDTLIAAVDGLEALLGTIDADTGSILAAVDTIETLIASTNTKLDTVITQTDAVEASLATVAGAVAGTEMQTDVVTLPAVHFQDVFVTGQGSQTALNQNIVLASAGTTGYDTLDGVAGISTRSVAIQIVPAAGTVTAGVVTFEGSNDNVNWGNIFLTDMVNVTTVPVGNITIVASTPRYLVGTIPTRYFRARISTGVTGTTTGLQAHTVFSTVPFSNPRLTVSQATAASLNATITGVLTTVTPGTAATNLGKARDSAIGATDTGIAMLGVRRDTPTAETPVAGDYVVPQVSANGEQWVRLAGELADDAAFTPATGRVLPVGFLADETATDSVDEGDAGISRMTLDRKQIITPYVHAAAGGWTPYKNLDVDESEDEIKGTAGKLGFIHVMNMSASVRYLKLYNATAASVTVGTTTPVLTFPIPTFASTNGAGFTINFGDAGLQFSTAITVAATTGFADNDTGAPGANEVIFNASYL